MAGFPSRSSICVLNAKCSRSTRYRYDAFLSFGGPDVRRGLVDHLFHAITSEGLRAFLDTQSLNRGGDISATLHHAIQVSRILMPIFSTNYAQSPWCLREASVIASQVVLQRHGKRWPIVIPLFYDVTPAQVRRPDESDSPFSKAFKEHEINGRHGAEEIQEWKAALYEICRLSGWLLREDFNGCVTHSSLLFFISGFLLLSILDC